MEIFSSDSNVCAKCKATCCYQGGPTLTKAEKKRILKAGFKNYFIPCHDGKGNVLPYKNWFDLKIRNGKCPYLKGCSCSIYKVRPLTCKIWPVFAKIEKCNLKYFVFACPLAPYLDKKGILKLKKMAESMPKRFYEISWGGLKPSEIKKVMKFTPVPFEKWMKRMK